MTIRYNGKTTTINGLPSQPVREWDSNIKLNFYDRGKRTSPTITKTGKFKPPRKETQFYVNGKYFIQFPTTLNQQEKEQVMKAFFILYCGGCDLDEIKRLFKKAYYKD